jgi:hypothetical protein
MLILGLMRQLSIYVTQNFDPSELTSIQRVVRHKTPDYHTTCIRRVRKIVKQHQITTFGYTDQEKGTIYYRG